MKNVFVRTALALALIPSFWMTSVGTAAAEWVDAAGEMAGPLAKLRCNKELSWCSNPRRVSFTVLGFYKACVDKVGSTEKDLLKSLYKGVGFMQFVPDYSATNTALSGLCYYYEKGSSSGESGPHSWRFDSGKMSPFKSSTR